jgi:putative membrane protein
LAAVLLKLPLCILLVLSFPVVAQPAAGADDLTFEGQLLLTLHGVNTMEIAAGQLAVARGNSVAIRQFGAQLVKDHRAADEQVLALALQRNVKIPVDVADDGLVSLTTRTGDAFDNAFLLMMLDGHIKTIATVKGAQARINNAAMKAFLQTLVPTLESHRDTAAALSKGN